MLLNAHFRPRRVGLLAKIRRSNPAGIEKEALQKNLSKPGYLRRFMKRALETDPHGELMWGILHRAAMTPGNAKYFNAALPTLCRDRVTAGGLHKLAMTSVGTEFRILNPLMMQDGVWPMYAVLANMRALRGGEEINPRFIAADTQVGIADNLSAVLMAELREATTSRLAYVFALVAALKFECAAKVASGNEQLLSLSDKDLDQLSIGLSGRTMHSLATVLMDPIRLGEISSPPVSEVARLQRCRFRLVLVANILSRGDRLHRELRNPHGAMYHLGTLEGGLFAELIQRIGKDEFLQRYRSDLRRYGSSTRHAVRLFELGLGEILDDEMLASILVDVHRQMLSRSSLGLFTTEQRERALKLVPPDVAKWAVV